MGKHCFLIAMGIFCLVSVATAQESGDLVDLEGSKGSTAATFCSLFSFATKSVVKTKEYIEEENRLEQARRLVANELATIYHSAQLEAGVSIDDVDPQLVGASILATLKDYDQSRANELAEATAEPEEEWSSFDYARTALSAASIADPTGVVGVAAAYTYPKCGSKEAETGVGGFCWRDSQTRGVGWIPSDSGRPADCEPGFVNTGLTCYKAGHTTTRSRPADCPAGYTNNGLTCGRAGNTISAPSRLASCPSGYANMGLTCYRGPHSYGLGRKGGCTTIFKKFGCDAGYTDMGCHCQRWAHSLGADSMTCPTGYFRGVAARCYKKCPADYQNTGENCTKWPDTQGIPAMFCPAGESKAGARCYKDCPTGYDNTGEFCTRWPVTKGFEGMSCKPGEFKSGARCYEQSACTKTENGRKIIGEMDAGLCYEPCKNNFYGVGPVCWSSCNGKLKTECAAGCASSDLECGLATTDMVASPFEVVLSVVSLSGYSGAKAARKAGMVAAREAAKEIAKEGAEAALKKGGRRLAGETAEQATQRIGREAIDALDEDLVEVMLRRGSDLADATDSGKDTGKISQDLLDDLAELDTLMKELDDVIKGLDDVAPEAAESSEELVKLVRRVDRAPGNDDDFVFQSARKPLVKRLENGLLSARVRATREAEAFGSFLKDSATTVKDTVKTNVYEPVKKVKDYVPNKLRKKTYFVDYFMQQRAKHGSKGFVSFGRFVRGCGKLGIVIAQTATE